MPAIELCNLAMKTTCISSALQKQVLSSKFNDYFHAEIMLILLHYESTVEDEY